MSFKRVLVMLLFALPTALYSQGSVSSTNGWTATINITPIDIIPSTTNCQWSYNYDVQYQLSVTFSGSTSNRSISGNIYFTCTGGSGGEPYSYAGTFTSDNTVILQTNNNSRGYSAVSSYNYGPNPDCNSITTADANCTSARLDYWGNGTIGSSITFSTGTPLPIELLYFTGKNQNEVNTISWATASEQNNDFIRLYRSFDGNEFEMIHEVPGQGNSNILTEYGFEDAAFDETVFYQLVQVDYDGTSTKSEIIAVSPKQSDDNLDVNLLPNPAQSHVSIQSKKVPSNIVVFDLNGNQVKSVSNTSLLDIQDLNAGVYFLQIEVDQKILTKRLVKS